MRFWDASAVVPLLVADASTQAVQAAAAREDRMLVWWGTEVECDEGRCSDAARAAASCSASAARSGVNAEEADGRLAYKVRGLDLVTLDDRLAAAARREGFAIAELT